MSIQWGEQAALARKLGVSRQRVWQLIQKRAGLCVTCPNESVDGIYCELHKQDNALRSRLWMRKKHNLKPWKKGGVGRPLKYE